MKEVGTTLESALGERMGQRGGRLEGRKGTFRVKIKQEPELQGSRNSDLQFKSKAVQSSCKHLLSQGSHLPLARNRL